ncbi:hypothetical protein Tco_0799760 [Tanacetum coccineum]|uniref:Uncharacterized protein n=1 Tax=Tanacetum coccineum TaxID=301880 RepID=A0ABQ4ZS84_9ASTR
MKSKVTGKSDSPRRRWIPLSDRMSNKPGDIVVNAQPISQYNPVTGQVVKESDKVQQPKVKPTVDEKDNPKEKPAVVNEKPAVVKEKPAGVTSKVSKAPMVKATVSDKAPVVKATVADNVVADKEPVKEKSAGNVGKETVADNVVADEEPVKEKSAGNVGKASVVKATVTDKALVVKVTVADNVGNTQSVGHFQVVIVLARS